MSGRMGMAGIASVLGASDAERIRSLWSILEEDFGLTRVSISPLPHVTYQAARRYDVELLSRIAEDLAAKLRPVRVLASGVGVFVGPRPIVYIPAVRTPELSRFHLAIWSAASVAAKDGLDEYLHPAKWIPHVTLAQGDLTAEEVGSIVSRLNREDLEWEVTLDNLSVIRGKGPDRPQELVSTSTLSGVPRNF
jgi:2'-5' RNA ligase